MPITFPLLGFDSTAPGDAYLAKLLDNARQQQALRADRTHNKYLGPQLTQALQKAFLENQKSQAESPYWGPMAAAQLATEQTRPGLFKSETSKNYADIPLIQAQAKRENALANMPFAGQMLPGAAGQVQGLEMLRAKFGENSPQYQIAKSLFDLQQQSMKSRNDYQNALSKTLPIRALTPTGKAIVEQDSVATGNMPTGQPWDHPAPGVTIPTSKQQANLYGVLAQKGATDSDARKRNLFASNMEKTIAQINPDDLTRYSGAGVFSKLYNSLAAPFGKESEDYDKYQASLTGAKLLAKQMRQFYGDSIQPHVQEELNQLTNPSNWNRNPKLAKELYYKLIGTLRNEMQTYRDALQSTAPYIDDQAGNQNILSYDPKTGWSDQ